MGDLITLTNHKYRNLKYGYEMPKKLRRDFDYIGSEGFDSHDFVEYKGEWYDLSSFILWPEKDWDGYISNSSFSGIVLKFHPDNNDQVMMGTFTAPSP